MQATILAKHGMTGPLDLFENRHGLKSVFPGIDWMESLTAPLPADSYIMSCHMKAYPCLATGQGIVAAGLDLHQQINGDVDRLKQITVAIADTPFAAAPEGRSGPHRSAIARGRRPQLQFPRRGRADRRRVRARTSSTTSAGTTPRCAP